MRKLLAALLLLSTFRVHAQLNIYDGFDDNANQWIVYANDTAIFDVANSKLSMDIRFPGDYINAKGAPFDGQKAFRVETSTSFESGADSIRYGICWGAADLSNFMAFYITGSGRYGFGQLVNGKWQDILPLTPCPLIHPKGDNWLRVNAGTGAKRKLTFCINEFAVKSIDFIQPPGEFFGTYVGGKAHILFDDFILYQRGAVQEEFEPVDLSLSATCKSGQLHYENPRTSWSCCVPYGCRADEDSLVSRFWFTDGRAADYSILVAPFVASSDGEFFNAVQRDFLEYMRDTADPVKTLVADKPQKETLGKATEVVIVGETYTAEGLGKNMYIRRYYVSYPSSGDSGLMLQFIVPENSKYISVLDALARQLIDSMDRLPMKH